MSEQEAMKREIEELRAKVAQLSARHEVANEVSVGTGLERGVRKP